MAVRCGRRASRGLNAAPLHGGPSLGQRRFLLACCCRTRRRSPTQGRAWTGRLRRRNAARAARAVGASRLTEPARACARGSCENMAKPMCAGSTGDSGAGLLVPAEVRVVGDSTRGRFGSSESSEFAPLPHAASARAWLVRCRPRRAAPVRREMPSPRRCRAASSRRH